MVNRILLVVLILVVFASHVALEMQLEEAQAEVDKLEPIIDKLRNELSRCKEGRWVKA